MKSRALLFLAIMLFLAGSVSSYVYEVDSLKPPISITYAEPVRLMGIKVANSTKNEVVLIGNATPTPADHLGQYFKFIPQRNLKNRETYTLNLTARDAIGNEKKAGWYFTINLLPVEITLIEPQHGVSSVQPYDVVIETNRAVTECRYNLNQNRAFPNMIKYFAKLSSTRLEASGFSGDQTIYIRCNDTYGEVDQVSAIFNLRFDNTPPIISSYYADPALISEEKPDGDLQTTLVVNTNEETVCKYSDSNVADYSEIAVGQSTIHKGFFAGNNESKGSTYKTNNQRLLGSYLGQRLTLADHTYYAACKNLAGLTSEVKVIDFSVDLDAGLAITVLSPLTPVNNTRVLLKIRSNKNSTCSYGNTTATSSSFQTSNGYVHEKTITVTKEGTYTYYFDCTQSFSGQQADQTSISFIFDKTKPSIPDVFAEDFICPDDDDEYAAQADWESEDNLSGISHYKYAISSSKGGSDIVSWRNGGEEVEEDGLGINRTTSVYWTVRAVDRAGNIGLEGYSDRVSVLKENDVRCTTSQANCTNHKKDGDETDVDCGGSCTKCGLGKKCSSDSDCLVGKCIYNPQINARVCTVSNQCSNNFKDTGETDVDCGGSECQPCGIGKDCSNNNDCDSKYCNSGQCDTPTCFDFIMNGYETDVDCGGGFCDSCENGNGCYDHSDCLSRYCLSGECAAANCNDGLNNGDETDVDCGGSCPSCGIGSSCKSDSDCSSGYCENYLCQDSSKKDTDHDGMPDAWESMYTDCRLNPNDPNDASLDPDADGITNREEYSYGTDPCNIDTDEDGYSDENEISAGYDPLDPNSHPRSSFWLILLILLIILILLVLAYFVGYPRYKQYVSKKKTKITVRPVIRTAIPGQVVKPTSPPEETKGVSEEHERFLKRMEERKKQRARLFEGFPASEKPQAKIKEEQAKPEKIDLRILAKEEVEKPVKEWMHLADLKKVASKKGESVFDKLDELSKKASLKKQTSTAVPKEKAGVLKELEEIAKSKTAEKTKEDNTTIFKNLRGIAYPVSKPKVILQQKITTPAKRVYKKPSLSRQQRTILSIAEKEGKISMRRIEGIYSSKSHAKEVAEHLVSVGYLKPIENGQFKFIRTKK